MYRSVKLKIGEKIPVIQIPDAVTHWLDDTDKIAIDLTNPKISTLTGEVFFPTDNELFIHHSNVDLEGLNIGAATLLPNLKQVMYVAPILGLIVRLEPTKENGDSSIVSPALKQRDRVLVGMTSKNGYVQLYQVNGVDAFLIYNTEVYVDSAYLTGRG